METAVHLRLPVSFFIVRQVVEQGQCISENSITLTAVIHVQPLAISRFLSSARLDKSMMLPAARYAIMMMGNTISLAGNPKINARRITPSKPKICANGSRKLAQILKMVCPSTEKFAISHMTSPAGAATTTARPNTNSVLLNIERIITRPTCGTR